MYLGTGKTRGFVVEGRQDELRRVANLPGAVWRRQEGVVRFPENRSSWKVLRGLSFEEVSESAEEALEALRRQYRNHRRQVSIATRRFKLTGETDIPVPLKTIPYEHQVRAFGFCSLLRSSALFMDMGTGKTLVAIALMAHWARQENVERILVLCPRQVKPVWPKEIQKHSGTPFNITVDEKPGGSGVWITNYDRVKREMSRIKGWKPQMIILDESHRIRNRKTARTKAVMALKADVKLILSGSPIGKCISQAWAQYNFLDKDVFGSYSSFKDRYLRMGGYMGYNVIGYKNEDEFSDKLHSLAFRVTKDECLDLPPLSYNRMYIDADKRTKDLYSKMDLDFFFEEEGEEVTVDREVTKQMKLRQIVGGVVKSDSGELVYVSTQKSETIRGILEDRINDKTIIYFSFTHEIKTVEAECKKIGMKYLILNGSTSEEDRNAFEDKFQDDPSIGVALIQVATGAEGMTLTAANLAVFYSPTFSFFSFVQARDRINRLGQARSMTIILLIMRGTVDERIADVLESNRQLTDTYLDRNRSYTMSKTESFTVADLAASLEISAADARKHLRAAEFEKPEGGWKWSNEKAAAAAKKAIQGRLKEAAAAPKTEKAPKAKAERAPKAPKVEEETTEAPKAKRTRKPAAK